MAPAGGKITKIPCVAAQRKIRWAVLGGARMEKGKTSEMVSVRCGLRRGRADVTHLVGN